METLKCTIILIILGVFLCTNGVQSSKPRKYGCVLPPEPMFGHFEFKDHTRQLVYVCEEGYMLSVIQSRRKCLRRNRKWTGKDGDCILPYSKTRCQKPAAPKDGSIVMYDLDNREKGVRFFCEPGFRLIGAETLTCKADGEWYGGTFPVCKSYKTVKDFANNLKEAFIDPLASATADANDCDVCGKLSAGKTGLDILFLLDVSASIGEESLKTAKDFLILLVEKFQISPEPSGGKNGTRIGLITFSTEADVVFALNDEDVRSVKKAIQKIKKVENKGGGTDLKRALKKAFDTNTRVLKKDKTRYASSTRAIFVLTDAEATFETVNTTNMAFVKTYSESLRNQKFEIFTIGVGSNIDKQTLELIASQPKHEHVFLLKDFKNLERVRDIIAETNIDYGQCGISGDIEVQTGGHDTKIGAWPWTGWVGVSMTKKERIGRPGVSYTCGGVLLCDRWFLTVAHCVSFVDNNNTVRAADPKMTNVNLGDHRIYEPDNTQIIVPVKNILIHPGYTGKEVFNYDGDKKVDYGVREYDFALLDLGEENPPPLHKSVRPICFPKKNNTGDDSVNLWHVSEGLLDSMKVSKDQGQKGYIAGWGHAPINTKIPFMLWSMQHQDRRKVQPESKCLKRYPGLDTDLFFCVYNEFGESDYCRGDVGGPLMAEMSGSRFTMLGLAARTYDCNKNSQYPFSIFQSVLQTNVSEWIEQQLDGCNRFEEDIDWASKMEEKREKYKQKLEAEKEQVRLRRLRKVEEKKRRAAEAKKRRDAARAKQAANKLNNKGNGKRNQNGQNGNQNKKGGKGKKNQNRQNGNRNQKEKKKQKEKEKNKQ